MVDTTFACTTFPDRLTAEISRDNAVDYLFDALRSSPYVIVVQGANGSGRSVLLAQFAKLYQDQCISFFIGTSPTKTNPHFVLLELCEQIAMILDVATDNFNSLPTDALKTLFFNFQRRLSREARKSGRHFFFVIDGLELLSDHQLNDLLDFLPIEPLASCSLLTTSEVGRKFTFRHEIWPILPFSEREAEAYFEALALPKDDIKRIQKSSGGLPGYLSVVRRLLTLGTKIEDLPSKLPNELRGLFDYEWKTLNQSDPFQSQLLSVITFSHEPLTSSKVSAILGVDENIVLASLDKLSFLILDKHTNTVTFSSEGYRPFSADKLASLREQTESLLIDFYALDPSSKESLYVLPSYLSIPSSV